MGAVQAALHEKLRESPDGHPWLHDAFIKGNIPGPATPANYAERIDGLTSLVGCMVSALDLLAGEIDGLKGHTHPPTR
jgi:hypothetical protein